MDKRGVDRDELDPRPFPGPNRGKTENPVSCISVLFIFLVHYLFHTAFSINLHKKR